MWSYNPLTLPPLHYEWHLFRWEITSATVRNSTHNIGAEQRQPMQKKQNNFVFGKNNTVN